MLKTIPEAVLGGIMLLPFGTIASGGSITIGGIGLSALVGVLLNLIIPRKK